MLDYGKVFPKSIPSLWERHPVLGWLRDTASATYYGLAARKLTQPLRALSPSCLPVVIINFNRLEALAQLVAWLQTLGPPCTIFILDNNSTYAPLLGYYEQLRQSGVVVLSLPTNGGTRSVLQVAAALRRFEKYIVTDGDLVPYATTPADILQKMATTLDHYPAYNHVGVSLEIEDLPAHYPLRDVVQAWEAKFWQQPLGADVYEAGVDTTFAMYRGTSNLRRIVPGLRLARPYTLQHVDWYINPAALTDEYRFYLRTCSAVATWSTKLRGTLQCPRAPRAAPQIPRPAPAGAALPDKTSRW